MSGVLLEECSPIAVLTVAQQKSSPKSGYGRTDLFGNNLPAQAEALRAQSNHTTLAHTGVGAILVIALNQTSWDWHTKIVTLNEVKGLAVRFFATLRMTPLKGYGVKCTKMLSSGLAP